MAGLTPKGPWSSSSTTKPAQQDDGESLLTVLPTAQDRGALTILLADCTELMRQSLLDTFDANNTGATIEQLDSVDDVTNDVDTKLVLNPEVDVLQQDDTQTTQKQKEEAQKKALERRQKELAGAKMQELKREAVAHFDDWRSAVIQRVGEIVNTRTKAEQQKDAAKPSEQQKPIQAESSVKVREPAVYDDSVTRSLESLYPPVTTDLTSLPEEKRALILHSVLLLLLSLEHYVSYSRVLLLRLTTSLHLPIHFLAEDERKVASGLLTAAENLQADEETKKAAEGNKDSRTWKVGLATVAGAALIGITGGLAAPLLAAGIGSVMGGLGLGATAAAGYLGTLAGSSVLVGGLFGAYGGRMTGKMMDQYAKEVEDFGFVPVRAPPQATPSGQDSRSRKNETDLKSHKGEVDLRRLRVAIGVSGWLTNKDEVVAPWHVVGIGLETFALRWELDSLMGLGNALTSMITSAAWGFAKSEIIKRTVFSALYAGLWPLALLKASRVIDNPWSVAHYRAVKTGEVLADALINKAQGERPVTLIGYSLGAKVIYTCLQRLADRKAFGLVESVVLIGAPTPSDSADWRAIRAVVSGRVVNVFSTKDYILAFLYRSSSIQLGVAGLQAIQGVAGVENVDVSELVSGHTAYRFLTGAILRKLGFEDVDSAALEKEQQALREEEARQEKEKKSAVEGEATDEAAEKSAKDLEEEVQQKNEKTVRSKPQSEPGKAEKNVIDHSRTQHISAQ